MARKGCPPGKEQNSQDSQVGTPNVVFYIIIIWTLNSTEDISKEIDIETQRHRYAYRIGSCSVAWVPDHIFKCYFYRKVHSEVHTMGLVQDQR